MAYDKSGRASDGSLDPKRKLVSHIMHMASIGGGSGLNLRQMGDDLYQTMVTGEPHGDWTFKKAQGGNGGDADDDGGKKKAPDIKDIDFPVKGGKQSMSDIYKPKVQKTFKEGGVVRGCGMAQRGKTRGKMV